jgi:lipoprotein-releasing system permease protein
MLITDKSADITTFLSMGATRELVQKIFHLHGFLISVTGCLVGTAVGLALAIIQQKTGIISIPGNYLISAYPVEIQFTDVAITVIGVLAVGFVISRIPAKKIF